MEKPRPPLPVGVTHFAEICDEGYYYVDKTLLIRKLIDYKAKTVLFTRPTRFGKSLNMDMLRTFFEIHKEDEDTGQYFKDKKIWTCGPQYTDRQGKYPVISLSFRGMSAPTWEGMLGDLRDILQEEFSRQQEMLDLEKLTSPSRKQFELYVNARPNEDDMRRSLSRLARILREAHGKPPVILIDEYDAPIENAWTEGYYDEAIRFMYGFLTPALKDNSRNMSLACLTGVLRVARESIFSGLNSLEVDGVLSEEYDEFFGFTPDEVREMVGTYVVPDAEDAQQKAFKEIEDWYEGYRFGNQEVFNPWSVVNYFRYRCKPDAYWANASNSDAIARILEQNDPIAAEMIADLLADKSVGCRVEHSLTYPDVDAADGRASANALGTLLLMSGYLTLADNSRDDSDGRVELVIPNREIRRIYRDSVQRWLRKSTSDNLSTLQRSIVSGNASAVQNALSALLRSASFHDFAVGSDESDQVREAYYHLLLFGSTADTPGYVVLSNREAGTGRYDICLEPEDRHKPGIILELKYGKDLTDRMLEKLAAKALKQVGDKDYAADLRVRGILKAQAFGIAFSGKNVRVAGELRKS